MTVNGLHWSINSIIYTFPAGGISRLHILSIVNNLKMYIKQIIIIFLYSVLFGASAYLIVLRNKNTTVKTFARSSEAEEKIIIDTDAGTDDAAAILLTIKSEYKGHKVLAITCSYGNTYVDNVVVNVLKTLTIANRSDIHVYRGAEKPLLAKYENTNYFGKDGFGDFEFTEKITAKVDESKHAAVALVEFVKKYPGEITLLSLGPSTNVAIAVTLYPSFLKDLRKHVILGASVAGIGNVLPNIEFNFYQDPESNYMVLNRTKSSVLFPWETALDSEISKEWREDVLGTKNSTIVNFLNKAEREYLSTSSSWSISDAMAAAVMMWPEFIIESTETNVSPVVDGTARGSVLVDYGNITGKEKNAKIVQKFNTTAFKEVLLKSFS